MGAALTLFSSLEELRLTCVNLARLRQNFSAEADGYEEVEQTILVEQLSPLQATFCSMERGAMLQADLVIVRFYQELAPPLAQTHGIPYPADLARVLYGRLGQLCNARLNLKAGDLLHWELYRSPTRMRESRSMFPGYILDNEIIATSIEG